MIRRYEPAFRPLIPVEPERPSVFARSFDGICIDKEAVNHVALVRVPVDSAVVEVRKGQTIQPRIIAEHSEPVTNRVRLARGHEYCFVRPVEIRRLLKSIRRT